MNIGQLSRRTGVPIDTVRYYEKQRLLPPPTRSASGYRHYEADDVLRLNFIRRAKVLGFTLDEIRDLLALSSARDGDMAAIRAAAADKLADVERRLAELTRMRDGLRTLVEATWRYYLAHPEFITLVNSANLHQGRHIAGNRQLRKLQKAYVDRVATILKRGEALRQFRKGVDPVQLCLTIAAIGFNYLNHRHTGPALFGFNFMSRDALARPKGPRWLTPFACRRPCRAPTRPCRSRRASSPSRARGQCWAASAGRSSSPPPTPPRTCGPASISSR